MLEELTNFYDTKIAKEEAYSSREGTDTPRKSRRTESSTAGGESPYSKTKNGSSFPKLPRDTLPVMGKMLYDRLNSWRALVMKHNYRSPAENKRLKSIFFDGISVKAYSTKTPDNDPSGKGKKKRSHDDNGDTNPRHSKSRRAASKIVSDLKKVLETFTSNSASSGGSDSDRSVSEESSNSARRVL